VALEASEPEWSTAHSRDGAGKMPPFIEALLPEGWRAQVLHKRDERDVLRSGKRYMSNIERQRCALATRYRAWFCPHW